ncbi:MAG: MgtC/SapB family protein [Candidatus Nitrotoga sp.]|nr:MgtC/SapB family protein [Candidatus Nitrotoga sp.]MDO9448146.1 MgtC/SapB family protein [Candidatus Nitrotoga sp.]MDP3498468.1 MgtC/SapB family protein [Candidatus Nitrotoga sp.]
MNHQIWQNNGIEFLPQFLASLAIGLLIGLERERRPSSKAGLRTFALVALMGTLAALLSSKIGSPWLLVTGFCIVGVMIIAAYLTSPTEENDPGTTTVAALLLCYALGALIWYGQTTLAVMLAIITTTLLYFKPELRGITKRLTRRDLVSILQFLVLTFVILPILPNQNYGPYDTFNPHQIWMMVVLISGLSLAGYVALHWTSQRYGAPLLGLLGGLVSSTATTLVYARHGKISEVMARLSAVVILLSSQVVLMRLTVLSAVVSPNLLAKLLPVMGLGLLFGLVVTLFDWRKLHTSSDLPMPKTSNPTEILTALSFGLLYAVVLFFSAWISDIAGSGGLYVVALISGLTDVDAITLSSLRLFDLNKLSDDQAVTAISLAFLSNMVFKFGLVVFIGGTTLAKHVAAGFLAMGVGVAVGLIML